MNVEQLIEQVKEFLGFVGKRRLWIQTHDIPDPDALAAAEAFRVIARHHGVNARIVVNGLPHRRENKALIKECQVHIRTLDSLKIRNPELSAWVFIDCLPDSGNVTLHPLAPGNLFMAIDHHGNPNMALHPDTRGYFIVDPAEGATATIVGALLLAMKMPFPPRLASALSYAIITDTQDFSRGASESDLRVYNALYPGYEPEDSIASPQRLQAPSVLPHCAHIPHQHLFLPSPRMGVYREYREWRERGGDG